MVRQSLFISFRPHHSSLSVIFAGVTCGADLDVSMV